MNLKKINVSGQTTFELLLVLCVSVIVLAIIYSLYAVQVQSSQTLSNLFLANSSVQKMVNAANTAYLSGNGSRVKVIVEFPQTANLEESVIVSNLVIVKMFSGQDIVGIADVNLSGSIRPQYGKQEIYFFF